MGIVTRPGMGDPRPGSAYQHDIGLDEGNHLGYVSICLWPSRETEGLAERRIQLRDRLAEIIAEDEVCQHILQTEKDASK